MARADSLLDQVRAVMARVQKLFDACDSYLTDPENPGLYLVGPRAEDIEVVYTEEGPGGKRTRRKAKLSNLLRQVGEGREFSVVELKSADPRDLVLRAAKTLQGHLELLAELMGELNRQPQANILVAPEWLELRTVILQILEPYPEARLALADRLKEVNGAGR